MDERPATTVDVSWEGGFRFVSRDARGRTLTVDVPKEEGDDSDGFMPGDMMLTSLVGCSGVDVVEILRKQRQQVTGIDVRATGVQGARPSLDVGGDQAGVRGDRQKRQREGGRAGDPALGDQVLLGRGHAFGPGQDQQHLQDRGGMSPARVVFLHDLPSVILDEIVSHTPGGFETAAVPSSSSEEELELAVADADFIIAFGVYPSDRVLRAAGKTRLVQLLAAGYDRMNLDLLREMEIPCANNGGANSWAVADHAVLLMLALYKQLMAAERSTRAGGWKRPIDGTNTFELAGKTVGILGMGNIGRQVARRVQAFDARVLYHDAYLLSPDIEEELGVERAGLDELFRSSDILSCHTPLTPETRRVVSRERLVMMRPTAVLINTSRGPVVDEEALVEALSEGRIAGAGLDVFEREPVDPGNPLLKMDNVVVTPHSAGTTWDTWARRARFAYDNIERVWRGEAPLAVVNGVEP